MTFISSRKIGILSGLGAAILFALTGMIVKVAVCSYEADIFQLGFIRFFSAGVLVLLFLFFSGKRFEVVNRKYFFLRGFFGAAGNFILFLVISLAGLGRGTVLMQLSGVFGAVAAVFLLKEKLNFRLLFSVAAAGCGILFCSGFDISGTEFWAVAGAICSGLALVYIREMSKTDSLHIIFFSQCICGTFLMSLMLLSVGFPCSKICWLAGLALTLADTAGQYLMTAALKRVPVAAAGPLLMTSPIIALASGILFFSEKLDYLQWIGSILILSQFLTGSKTEKCNTGQK